MRQYRLDIYIIGFKSYMGIQWKPIITIIDWIKNSLSDWLTDMFRLEIEIKQNMREFFCLKQAKLNYTGVPLSMQAIEKYNFSGLWEALTVWVIQSLPLT